VSFFVILATQTKRVEGRFVMALAMVFLVGAALLTGRRKALVEVTLFLAAYSVLLVGARLRVRKSVILGVVAVTAIASTLALEIVNPDERASFDPYLEHGMTGYGDAPQRFGLLGIGSVEWAIERHGILGAGAGAGSQGAQHFGGGESLVGGAAEGGLGKVVAELGIPGLLAVLWLVAAAIRCVWRSLKRVPRADPRLAMIGYGLVAFLGANALTFVVASQVFGDMFVLLLLGVSLGFTIAVPQLAAESRVARAPQAAAAYPGMAAVRPWLRRPRPARTGLAVRER
jgi:O-antigen ligase